MTELEMDEDTETIIAMPIIKDAIRKMTDAGIPKHRALAQCTIAALTAISLDVGLEETRQVVGRYLDILEDIVSEEEAR